MITNLEEGGKIKCQRYWPESGRCQYGPFEVTLTDEQIMTDYTIRKLEAFVSSLSKQTCHDYSYILLVVYTAKGPHWETFDSDSISLHCLTRPLSTRLCHTSPGLLQESLEGTQAKEGAPNGSLLVHTE